MEEHNCYKNLKRLGRANYQCDICKRDMSMELLLIYEAVGEKEFNKMTNVIKDE